jgi:hypothetical protein
MAAQKGKIEVCNMLLKMKGDANATDVVSGKNRKRSLSIVRNI